MKGKVYAINRTRGMIAIKTSEGYSIFELLGNEEIKEGDEIEWKDDTPLGSEQIMNLNSGESFEVYFQNHRVNEANLRKQLLL